MKKQQNEKVIKCGVLSIPARRDGGDADAT